MGLSLEYDLATRFRSCPAPSRRVKWEAGQMPALPPQRYVKRRPAKCHCATAWEGAGRDCQAGSPFTSPETSLGLSKTFVPRWAVRWFAAVLLHPAPICRPPDTLPASAATGAASPGRTPCHTLPSLSITPPLPPLPPPLPASNLPCWPVRWRWSCCSAWVLRRWKRCTMPRTTAATRQAFLVIDGRRGRAHCAQSVQPHRQYGRGGRFAGRSGTDGGADGAGDADHPAGGGI
jgi:hypothetical protein